MSPPPWLWSNADYLREAALSHYGHVCACCGCGETEDLTIDHVDGDGAEHRRWLGGGSERFYRWLIENRFPEGFQTLCRSCNSSKGRSGRCQLHSGEPAQQQLASGPPSRAELQPAELAGMNPARRRMHELFCQSGAQGTRPKLIVAQLAAEGMNVTRQTVHKWLKEDAAAGLVESASFGMWRLKEAAASPVAKPVARPVA